jgi:hypothetical protein
MTKESPDGRNCGDCLHFAALGHDDAGQCRVNPPVHSRKWPFVNAKDWCGAFRSRAVADNRAAFLTRTQQ